ncbi:MAG: IS200/IS605 family transposase [Planctomycetota bacterium]|nr:IS200/IS605 family transposase [Planctomycetota bacterium]
MAHSYVSNHVHYVFSTKDRQGLITPDLKERLWAYMGGIAREDKMKALTVGGTDNHAHILLSLPSTMTTAKAVQLIKGGSSKWIGETFSSHRNFEWQEGYGAFSVSVSLVNKKIGYITNQEEHHRTRTFEEEFIAFLDKHDVEYDKRYVFG